LINFLLREPIQLIRLLTLAIFAALCLGFTAAIVMQKTQQQVEPQAIQRVVSPPAVSFNWFGGEVQSTEDITDIPKELANANIDAKLLGVVMAGPDSSATMKYSRQLEAVYFTGDQLDSNTTIVEIQPYRIVVNQNGVNKQIVMEKPDAVITTEQGSTSAGDSASNGFALANMFGAVPVMAGGSTGFKINNLSTEVQQLADIQEGDVVTQVNGVSIREIMADPSQWINFSSSTSLPVTVLRNGQEQVIYINASSLSAKMLPNLGFKP